jgi:signal transduction histidine kinase
VYFTIGISLFLFAFLTADFIAGYLVDKGITSDFNLGQYGLFGMPVFIGFLAYLIVKFKAFSIKLLGAQVIVLSLVALVGSELFFADTATNQILILVTLLISIGFGYILVRSVKNEVKRKEELQQITEKLAQANDQLRVLDNAKSEFISIASHQLRTPLTSVKGYVSLLMEGTYGEIDPKIMDPLKKIYASNEHLVQLVEELLNVSRIESGRMEYQFAKHDIKTTIKELYDTFAVIAKERNLYLHLDIAEASLPDVEIDAGKTREIISNLIDNALKYTKRGGVTVRAERTEFPNLSAKGGSASGGKSQNIEGVRITVSDTGIGVPKEEMPYLFSKFSRGSGTRKLSVSGTGLGLYVGKSMIEAQHAKIWLESEGTDKGSKFIIELPVEQPKV